MCNGLTSIDVLQQLLDKSRIYILLPSLVNVVYGGSAVSAGYVVGGLLGVLMNKRHLRLYFLITIVGYSLTVGTAGAMVLIN